MNSSSTAEEILLNDVNSGITTQAITPSVIEPIFKNKVIIDYYSAPINQGVNLNEHKLILKDISNKEENIIAHLTACAIFLGDVKAAAYFKQSIDNQNMSERYKDKILAFLNQISAFKQMQRYMKLGELPNLNTLTMYESFCQYYIRFECRHAVSPVVHPFDKAATFAMFGIAPVENKNDIQENYNSLTLQSILSFFKTEFSNDYGKIIPYLTGLKKYKQDDLIIKLLELFNDGKYLEYYALIQKVTSSENSKPSLQEVVLYNNSESFESAMAELKFTPGTSESQELMKLAIENGKTHAVKYFIKLGIEFELCGDLLLIAITHQHNSIIHLYLQIKSRENNYQEILKSLFQKACYFGNLEIVKLIIETQAISEDEIIAAACEPIIDIQCNPYGWEIKNYLTCKTIDILVNKEKELSHILIDLLKNAVTKEKIEAILPLLHHLRDNRKTNILKLCGDITILNSLAAIIDKKYSNNPTDKTHEPAKIRLLTFFLKEDRAITKDLLQKPFKETSHCLLSFAVAEDAGSDVINFLIDLYLLHQIALPADLLKNALEAHAPDKVIHKLLLEKKLDLIVEPNYALQCLVHQDSLSENPIHFQRSKIKDELIGYLYELNADPFSPFQNKSSVIDLLSHNDHNFPAIKCMIPLYQLYWDKISDILSHYVEPNVLNHLVMSYANNTPYFASVNHVTFFACRQVRAQAMQNQVGTSVVADQKDDKTNKVMIKYQYSS